MTQRYEISFLLDKELHQFQFMADPTIAREIQAALDDDMSSLDFGRAGDIQVYEIGDCGTSAMALVDTILNASSIEDDISLESMISELKRLAEEVDNQAGNANAPLAIAYLAEFVWNNGGGDDNAFAQSFSVQPGEEATAAKFIALLSDVIDQSDVAYDFSCGPQDGKHELLDIAGAIAGAIEIIQGKEIPTPRLDALRQAHALADDTPQPASIRPRHSL